MHSLSGALSLVAAAALVAGGMSASAASGHRTGNNLGPAVPLKPGQVAPAKLRPASPTFNRIRRPNDTYVSTTCAVDLSAIEDFTDLSSVEGCGTTLTFSSTVNKRSVPNSWQTWGRPPKSESKTPDLLYTNGSTGLTIDFGVDVHRGGFELEPDQFQRETLQVDLYAGPDGTGDLVGTIIRRRVGGPPGPPGSGDARLFAVTSAALYRSAVITDLATDDFGIAQIRLDAG
jgi:hypothetical protein